MNVLVFSSAMTETDFASFQNDAKIKPNPSNQNFYSKLIKAIALRNNVSVISHRPFVKGMLKNKVLESEETKEGNTTFYYTHIEVGKVFKLLREQNEIIKTAHKAIEEFHSNDFIIVTDTLRLSLITAARKVAEEYGVKIVGMLTDNPDNLSFRNKSYSHHLKSNVRQLDGYLSLSEGLVQLYGGYKPSYVFEGLVDSPEIFKKDPIYDYFFFAGSLYERYGVKTLVDAFHESNVKSKLIVAGSGPLAKYIEHLSYDDYRILYLPQLPREKILGYERNALVNINPRPLNSKLDNESVPSKLLEYLSNGIPVLSTKFPKLYGPFKDDVYWIEDASFNGMKKALEDFAVTDKEEANKKANTAKMKAFEFYGLEVQSESINHFLTSLSSATNN
ncbi:MAG: glycosyltransferase [Firmicutes bacterium]|nr:glycosyltransferase [Candidatus Fiminaster equi]